MGKSARNRNRWMGQSGREMIGPDQFSRSGRSGKKIPKNGRELFPTIRVASVSVEYIIREFRRVSWRIKGNARGNAEISVFMAF